METHSLSRRVLRAIHALSQRDATPSIRSLLAIVPDSPTRVCATLLALDAHGYIDGERLRLTLSGFAALQAPRAIAFTSGGRGRGTDLGSSAFEGRRGARLRKASHVA